MNRRQFLGGSLAGAGLLLLPRSTHPRVARRPVPPGAPRTPAVRDARPLDARQPNRVATETPVDPITPGAPTTRPAGYLLDTPVYGGELQYFRMTPSTIPSRLELCQEAAYSVIQTYVPWNVHEFVPGHFDFTGKTHPILPNDHHLDPFQFTDPIGGIESGRRGTLGIDCNTDLQGFLTMCKDAGFKVILRPGPFISDEWNNGGIPPWFLETAPPDTFMYGPVGGPLTPGAPFASPPATAAALGGMSLFYFVGPSYASPYYLAAVKSWLAAFAQFVRPWLATAGGPVVAVQVDDETCYYYNFGPFEVDYNPAMLARFHQATGMDAPLEWPDPLDGVAGLRPAFAWQRFKGQQIGAYLATLRDDLQAAGVDVPITHEIELSLAPPADVAADATAVLLNPELYPGANGPEAMPLIELTANAIRAAQRNRLNVWSAETQSGQVLLYTLLLGEGIIGSLQFTYATGVPDDAVASSGLLGQALRTAGPLLTDSTRRADVAIVWDNDLTRAPYGSQRWGFRTDVRAVIERHVPALATLLLRSGYAFDLLDTTAAAPEDYLGYPTIFLAASDIVPRPAQEALVAYVRNGGRLVCWAAPPTLDAYLEPCTVLADACFSERTATFYPEDTQSIELLGERVSTYLGVQTFTLSSQARAIAWRDREPCGYERRYGSGTAVLLGSWLAADSVPERAGEVLEQQPLPTAPALPATADDRRTQAERQTSAKKQVAADHQTGELTPAERQSATDDQTLAAARALAKRHFGVSLAEALPTVLPGGPAQTLIIYDYTNQRRGGEYIAGGAIAYWNGEHVVGLAELNTALTEAPIQILPYRPADTSHVRAAQALAGVHPQVGVTDLRIQARVLDAAEPAVATVVANNRFADDVDVVLTTTVGGRPVRLPTVGSYRIPAKTGVVLPVGYPLGHEVTVVQATAQLLSAETSPGSVVLRVWTPSPGEVVLHLPAHPETISVNGRAVALPTTKSPPAIARDHPGSARAAQDEPQTASIVDGSLVLDVAAGVSAIAIRW